MATRKKTAASPVPAGQERLAADIAGRIRDFLNARSRVLNQNGKPIDGRVVAHTRNVTSFTHRTVPDTELTRADLEAIVDLLDPPKMEDQYDAFDEHTQSRPPSRHNDDGITETHPSWGMASVSKFSTTGVNFFDSELTHRHGINLRIKRATRQRQVKRDYLHADREIIEVMMSEAQWGALVSSFGDGAGVPVTISSINGRRISEAPHESRLALSIAEVENATAGAMQGIQKAYAAVDDARKKKPGALTMAVALNNLESAIRNAAPNMNYAASTLTEHVENVVTKARADIESMVEDAVERRGIDPSRAPGVPMLELGS